MNNRGRDGAGEEMDSLLGCLVHADATRWLASPPKSFLMTMLKYFTGFFTHIHS